MRYIDGMNLDRETCYQAVLSRDRRFDGWFFVAVTSTGIYCRPVCPVCPVCPVRPPKLANCRFYANAALAEHAGFRPCLRCRPELAPGHGLLDVSPRLAHAAAALIDGGFLNDANLTALAARVDVSARLRALGWPNAFPVGDPLSAVGVASAAAIENGSHWAPWRAYAAQHLALRNEEKASAA